MRDLKKNKKPNSDFMISYLFEEKRIYENRNKAFSNSGFGKKR